jgi:mono/diheme cytochrome c family protein
VLYAFEAITLKLLWKSPEGALHTSGKYNEPLIVGGTVFVGTDRIQAFGLRQPGQKAFLPANPPGQHTTPGTVPPGKELFLSGGACAVCHGINGEGQVGVYPPLAGSEWVNGPEERLIRILLHGLQGPITASGKQYNAAAMPGFGQGPKSAFNWSDEKIAQVLTYIRQEWGNIGAPITTETVTRIRQETGGRDPWTQEELLKIRR